MSDTQQELSVESNSDIIKVMPANLSFNGLTQDEINYFTFILASFDEKAQSQILHLIEEQVIFVRINCDLQLEIKTNLA